MKRLFYNSQQTREGVRKIYEGMISTSSFGTFGLIASRGTKDTKGTVKLINLKQTDNAMAKK